jgi:hypothetical protein
MSSPIQIRLIELWQVLHQYLKPEEREMGFSVAFKELYK